MNVPLLPGIVLIRQFAGPARGAERQPGERSRQEQTSAEHERGRKPPRIGDGTGEKRTQNHAEVTVHLEGRKHGRTVAFTADHIGNRSLQRGRDQCSTGPHAHDQGYEHPGRRRNTNG